MKTSIPVVRGTSIDLHDPDTGLKRTICHGVNNIAGAPIAVDGVINVPVKIGQSVRIQQYDSRTGLFKRTLY